jgi:protein disulfide-isomerase A6
MASYYTKVMSKIVEKGDSYVAQELGRLERLLSANTVSGDQKDNVAIRRNILRAFTGEQAHEEL